MCGVEGRFGGLFALVCDTPSLPRTGVDAEAEGLMKVAAIGGVTRDEEGPADDVPLVYV